MTDQTNASGKFVAFVQKYNPSYLLSAACMLAGCVALVNDTAFQRINLGRILTIAFTLLVYQLALFGVAGFLVIKRSVLRDARFLFVLDAIFLSDVTYVLANLIAVDVKLGLGIGLVSFGLGLARIIWVSGRLNSPIPLHRLAFILSIFLMLLAIPAYLKTIQSNGAPTPPIVFHVIWWLVGLVTAAAMLADDAWAHSRKIQPAEHRWLYPTYAIVLWASLILHVGLLHWVYDVHYFTAMASPMLLSFAIATRRVFAEVPISRSEMRQFQCLLLGNALLASMPNPGSLIMPLPVVGDVSPLLLTVAAMYLAIVHLFLARHAIWWLGVGAALLLAHQFGSTVKQFGGALEIAALAILRAAWRLVPTTRFAWGVLSIISSFLLLGVGVMISLRKPPQQAIAVKDESPGSPLQ